MAYEGGRLRDWFDTAPVDRFLRRAAHKGGQRFREAVTERTPIRTGHLRNSYKSKPVLIVVNELGERVYTSGPYTEVSYAPFVEHGTGLWGPKHAKYLIVPKDPDGWLHWIDPHTGQDVFAKRVMHPGSPGAHMFAIAAGVVEAELGTLLRGELERWRVETERQNRSDWHLGAGRLPR